MKVFLVLISIFMLDSAYPDSKYLRDENHNVDFRKDKEEERQDIHKPGQISEKNADEEFEERQEDVEKDIDPEYDPIDDDLEEDEASDEDL